MSSEPRPEPEPLEIDERIPAGIGTVLWALALVIVLLAWHRLPAADHWWVWVCVAGACGGAFGYFYIPYLKRTRKL